VRNDNRPNNADESIGLRAAQYVRMSTEHQKYSTQNQADAIAEYAARHNFTIVRTYADEGRSGLRLDGRQALKDLISDVLLDRADFDRILVYDVSRWGRFQDVDESAHYEFICKEAGVRVEYCAEDFLNDGSLMSTVMKNLKRAMAGEYSRELSTKVFAGQCRLIKLGFRQGGPPGFGLRRQLIDERGQSKGLLKFGERKHLQSDRVILQPGPPHELELVRDIFRQFVFEGKAPTRIARELNRNGSVNHYGRPWTGWAIHCLLKNENYIGNNLYNRTTFRLGQKGRTNARNLWIRATGVLEPIVEPDLFLQAQEIKRHRRISLSNREMLARLSSLFREKGKLNRALIDEADHVPHSTTFINRFGSLRNAYKLIAYYQKSSFDFIEGATTAFVIATIAELAADLVARVEGAGGSAEFDKTTYELTINRSLRISIYIARSKNTEGGWQRWVVRRRGSLGGDLIIALRMDRHGNIIDYLLLPVADFPTDRMEFSEKNPDRLDACRFDTVESLFQSIWRSRNDPSLFPRIKQGRPRLRQRRSV
jgi:DNA invertase Pin-like site-specific DNA recombinase